MEKKKEINTGVITQIIGPVVDVYFEKKVPEIYGALRKDNIILEVQEQLGGREVRTIAMGPTEGISRGDIVIDMEGPISTPVGNKTLGRILNVFGEPVDGGKEIGVSEKWAIHKRPPKFFEQN